MKLLLISHGHLASGLITSYRMIAGDNQSMTCIELLSDGVGSFREKLKKYFRNNDSVLALADVKGGTPYNEVLQYYLQSPGYIRLVSGLNLPMLLEVGTKLDQLEHLQDACELAKTSGKNGVEVAIDESNFKNDIEF
ncbi:PTS sugar transporter subunit IIA [Loigolactobacillus rennini]|nr:hypothetical protein [Loigolactobacillus rennini]SFZ88614.1 PTS system, mannose-specific IIB component / PTS system, mannose-specific IIA component [Loigolactobacillus rennini]